MKASERKVLFCMNQDSAQDATIYHEIVKWLKPIDDSFSAYTTAELSREMESADSDDTRSVIIDWVLQSEYVITLVGDQAIDPESLDFQVMNTAAWMKRPIIATNLNQRKDIDRERFPALLGEQLILHIPLERQILKHALQTWKDEAFRLRTMAQVGPTHFEPERLAHIAKGRDFHPHGMVNHVPHASPVANYWRSTVAA